MYLSKSNNNNTNMYLSSILKPKQVRISDVDDAEAAELDRENRKINKR